MDKLFKFLSRERFYILLLVCIIAKNALSHVSDKGSGLPGSPEGSISTLDPLADREVLEKALHDNKTLGTIFGLTTLLFIVLFAAGVVIGLAAVYKRLSGEEIVMRTYSGPRVRWDTLDVIRASIVFIFFGYMFVIFETVFFSHTSIIKNDSFRTVFNTVILDIFAVLCVIKFSVIKYKDSLISLGLSMKNFSRNLLYGISGYISIVPVPIKPRLPIALPLPANLFSYLNLQKGKIVL